MIDLEMEIERVHHLEFEITQRTTYPTYAGPYEVTPRIRSQTLDTSDKLMRSDLEVHGIPRWDTVNPYGTTTVIGEY